MTEDKKITRQGDLFVVDNSISGWDGLRYLREWCTLSDRFDIATGYFEIGALLELDGEWQRLKKIRILMGSEVTERTKQAILQAVSGRAQEKLDSSLEDDKDKNPFLTGVPAIVEAIESGQIECKVYNKHKFHAKAYITHAKQAVIGSKALVGSSNFTRPGLTQNVELNIQVQSGSQVAELQEWFEHHWDEAEDVSTEVIETIKRHTREYTPFDVYAKAMQELFRGHEMTASEWEDSGSQMFQVLDQYQKEGYWSMKKIARRHGGAFLCDGVGLGKTFVGLMLIERLIVQENKRVILFAPKGAKEGVWEPHLRDWLPFIGGTGGGQDFSNLAVFSHTDLDRKNDFPERFTNVAKLADAIIIDEAHHFRNRGKRGDEETKEGRSRYYKLYDLMDDQERAKSLFLLTATPINNRLSDFRHMAELFTRQDNSYFAGTLGVNNLTTHFNKISASIEEELEIESTGFSERVNEAQDVLRGESEVFKELVVQRSRSYVKESQTRELGSSTMFPTRMTPEVTNYSLTKTYGALIEKLTEAFRSDQPLFSLPIYYPLNWYIGDDSVSENERNRQKQTIGLIRTLFLKRFESSVAAFELSSDRLLRKLMAFVQKNSDSDMEQRRFAEWKTRNETILTYAKEQQRDLFGEGEGEGEDDVMPLEYLGAVERPDREEYDVEKMIDVVFEDMDRLVGFLEETEKVDPSNDDKLKKLKRLLKTKKLKDHKVLIFTESADTARYLYQELKKEDFEGLAMVTGGSAGNRADVIKQFAPYYNGSSSGELIAENKKETRILISTDVLSEGLNLQDACRMINYEIHWNPVRLMQRVGRVDRRLDPEKEKNILEDHPDLKDSRGKVWYWNFLPPGELDSVLGLYRRVTNKTLLISKTLGIEGRQLLTEEDHFQALKNFNASYEGQRTSMEDMHLEYQDLLGADEELEGRLQKFPGAIFSGRKYPSKGTRGVFFCYVIPALDKEQEEFTEEAGTTKWYFYDLATQKIEEEPSEIITLIRSKPNTRRLLREEQELLIDIKKKISKHIHDADLKRMNAPIYVKPTLKCWMELNGG